MIRLENVTKYYITPNGRHYVLKDVNVEIPSGKKVAVLGLNGAGKSTLLRLFGGVDVPNSGKIYREGKISWPMGLASCLQKSMTGMENARFACRIQGATGPEINDKLKGIEDFAEIGDYFNMPIGSYSSGMRARLQFAIAMAFDFDCYLLDELSSVGDQSFRSKSDRVFREKHRDASFIKVSHNMGELMKDCEAGLLLHDAQLTYFDSMFEAARAYQAVVGRQERRQLKKQRRSMIRQGIEPEVVDAVAPMPNLDMSPQQRQARRHARKQIKMRKQSRLDLQNRAIAIPENVGAAKLTREERKARRLAIGKRRRGLGASAAQRSNSATIPRRRVSNAKVHKPAPMAPRAKRPQSIN